MLRNIVHFVLTPYFLYTLTFGLLLAYIGIRGLFQNQVIIYRRALFLSLFCTPLIATIFHTVWRDLGLDFILLSDIVFLSVANGLLWKYSKSYYIMGASPGVLSNALKAIFDKMNLGFSSDRQSISVSSGSIYKVRQIGLFKITPKNLQARTELQPVIAQLSQYFQYTKVPIRRFFYIYFLISGLLALGLCIYLVTKYAYIPITRIQNRF